MTDYLLIVAATIAFAGGGYGHLMNQQNKTLRLQVAAVAGQLASCGARLENLIEDVRSDNEIDNLSDDALRNVPAHWLRPENDNPGN